MERNVALLVQGILITVVGIALAIALPFAFVSAGDPGSIFGAMCIGGVIALVGAIMVMVAFFKMIADTSDRPPPPQYPPGYYAPPQYPAYQQPYQQPYQPGQDPRQPRY